MPRTMWCDTCKSDETHRPLNDAEKKWARDRTARKYVGDFWLCTKPACRNLRTGGNKRPFPDPVRLPVPE
ncbi:hypothetical protein AB0D12_14200 [Streptomyces sp. NPDC048479]|uniref:hypothetical protein n=1 Tax=Streptomyces sp. NPDC048479 TaxID=3154725 RepID=UPI00343113F7